MLRRLNDNILLIYALSNHSVTMHNSQHIFDIGAMCLLARPLCFVSQNPSVFTKLYNKKN